jgi:integrase
MDDTIDEWATITRTGNAGSTVALHTRYLRRLATTHDLGTVTTTELAAWIGEHDWRPNTRKSAVSALRSYFAWAVKSGRRGDDPAAGLPKVRVRRSVPRPVSDRTFVRAMQQARDDDDMLMLLLARGSGLRRAEIAALHTDDLDGDEIWVRGKGDKERVVGLHPQAARMIRQRQGWVFPGRFDGHRHPDYVGRHLSRMLGPGWSAHNLRHSFATAVYEASGDVLALQELMGHESPETTRRYARPSRQRLRDVGQLGRWDEGPTAVAA